MEIGFAGKLIALRKDRELIQEQLAVQGIRCYIGLSVKNVRKGISKQLHFLIPLTLYPSPTDYFIREMVREIRPPLSR